MSPTVQDRLVSLDVFRGLTIAGMVLVNNPGTWSSIYWPLQHAQWHGWTPTDLVFPFSCLSPVFRSRSRLRGAWKKARCSARFI